MPSHSPRSVVRLALIAGLLAMPALATTLLRTDVASLTAKSDAIVRGTVVSVVSRWSADRSGIYTEVELRVSGSLKGAPGERIRIIQPGGVVGDIGQHVSGLATFREQEDVLVFLEQRGSIFRVRGLGQGKYRIERSAEGLLVAIPESLASTRVIDPTTREEITLSAQAIPLAQLELQIHDVLRKGSETTPGEGLPRQPVAPSERR